MKGKKIVLVEDEVNLRTIMRDVLESKGFNVVTTSNGEEAVVRIKKELPALVLLDIILPKKNGFEVLEELKSDSNTKDIPVMLLTNLSQPHDIQKALDLGATTYLVKSEYQLEDIVRKIEDALDSI